MKFRAMGGEAVEDARGEALTRRLGWLLAVLAVVIYLSLQIFAGLDALSAEMRVSGQTGGTVSDLTLRPPARWPTEAKARDVVTAWRDHEQALDDTAGRRRVSTGRQVAAAYLQFDVAFIAVYGGGLVLLLAWRRRHRHRATGDPASFALAGLLGSRLPFVAVGLAVAADIVENVAMWRVVDQLWGDVGAPVGGLVRVSAMAGALKWLLLVLAVTPALVGVARWCFAHWRILAGLWFQLVLVAAFVALLRHEQAVDVVRGWDLRLWAFGLAAVGFLSVVLAVTGSRVLDDAARRPVAPPVQWWWRLLAVTLLGVAAGALAKWSPVPGLAIPCAMAALIYAASIPVERRLATTEGLAQLVVPLSTAVPLTGRAAGETEPRRRWTATVVAVVPLVAVLATAVAAHAQDVFYVRHAGIGEALGDRGAPLLAAFLLAPLVVVAAAGLLRLVHTSERARPVLGCIATGVAGSVVALIFDYGTFGVAPAIGTVAVASLFIAAIGGLGALLHYVGRIAVSTTRLQPWALPPVLRLLRFGRPPLVLGVVVWAVVAAVVDSGQYHAVRVLRIPSPPPLTVAEVVARWEPVATEDGSVPVVLVSASGGGIRAAYWTAAALTCVLEREAAGPDPCGAPASAEVVASRRSRLFAVSGVSGGSLGLVTYDAHARAARAPVPSAVGRAADYRWYQSVLGQDYLAPTVARWFFGDAPNLLLRTAEAWDDRAAVLERGWERAWHGPGVAASPLTQPFLAAQSTGAGPLLLLNGYSVEDGCRFNASVLGTTGARGPDDCSTLLEDLPTTDGSGPASAVAATRPVLDATTDLVDFARCGYDIRSSTAALLSARFPWVAPSGRLDGCDAAVRPVTFVVDGGYRDVSAASTLTELWPAMGAALGAARPGEAVMPVYMHLDNGYEPFPASRPERTPNEFTVPLEGQRRAMGGIAHAARQSAERLFPDTFVMVATRAHPGSEAPLGWVLSRSARDDLERQLAQNATSIARVRCLIDHGRACLVAAGP